MTEDYRDTEYCPGFENVKQCKREFMELFRTDHPRAKDVHRYVSNNDDIYKSHFMKVYNGKCAYCGASIKIIPKSMLEIDHFIPHTAACFNTKADAGYIENLVLSCHTCNHNKSDFQIPIELQEVTHPDNEGIKSLFFRDELYYIRVADGAPEETMDFYYKLKLDRPSCRVDYLLLNMIGLYEKVADKPDIHEKLGQAIELLREKRNSMC